MCGVHCVQPQLCTCQLTHAHILGTAADLDSQATASLKHTLILLVCSFAVHASLGEAIGEAGPTSLVETVTGVVVRPVLS